MPNTKKTDVLNSLEPQVITLGRMYTLGDRPCIERLFGSLETAFLKKLEVMK